MQDALYEGAAALPDMILNAPNRVMNLGKALFGSVATASGRIDLAPTASPDPDLVRRAVESLGLIRNVKPQGFAQRATSTLLKGAVGGALTGGASLPGAVAGGTMGALSAGAGDAVAEVTKSPEAGIAAGLLAPAGAAKVFGGRQVSPHVRTLADEGVLMTPGQILGGGVQRAEDALTSMPVTGDVIRNAQRRGHETLNLAATNRALEPVGEKVPPGTKAGRESVAFAQDRLGQLYDDLLGNMKGSLDGPSRPANALPPPGGLPPSFRDEIENLRKMMNSGNIPPEQKRQFSDILDNEIIARFTPTGGVAPGVTLKEVESQLGNLSSTFARSDNYDVRRLSAAVKESQAALRRMLERENPQNAGDLRNVNEGYANFKRVQDASGRVASTGGIFSPAALQSAVRSGDRSKDKSQFTRGEALMQDLSEAGKSVMTKTVPDSGTPLRHLFTHPSDLADPRTWLTLATAPAYSEIGQRAAQKVLTAEPKPEVHSAARAAVVPLAEQVDERSDRAAAPKPAPAPTPDAPPQKSRFTPDAVAKPKQKFVVDAPRKVQERVVGTVYHTPKGKLEWTEDGWIKPK